MEGWEPPASPELFGDLWLPLERSGHLSGVSCALRFLLTTLSDIASLTIQQHREKLEGTVLLPHSHAQRKSK